MKKSIIVSIILVGVTAMASQIVLVRELLIVFYGNELSIAFIIASWLIGGAAGSALLGPLSDKLKAKITAFCSCQIALAVLLPLTMMAARSIRLFLGINPGEVVALFPIAAASLAILLPICVILGFMFSLASRIYKPERVLGASRIGEVYILEALGAMAGGMITSFILIRYLNSTQIMAVLSLLMAAAAFALCRASDGKLRTAISALAGLLFAANIILWLSGGWMALDRYSIKMEWQSNELLASKNSIYGNVTMARKGSQFSFFDNGLHLFTVPDSPSAEEAVHFALLEHPDPKRVLLIGGGAGGLLREILKHPIGKIDYIELDPLIIKMAEEYLPEEYRRWLADPKVSTIFEDGRRYVKRTAEKYDVVIVNLGDPYTAQLNRFYTVEFFKEARRILTDEGILSFGLSSSESYIGKELADFLRSIYATLDKAFVDIKIIPGETAYFLASPKEGMLSYDYKFLMARAKKRNLELKYVREYYLFSKMSPELTLYTEGIVKGRGHIEINRDFRPAAYYYGLISWAARFKDSNFKNILKAANVKTVWSAISIIYVIIFAAGLACVAKKRVFAPAAMLSLMANGFSQMAFQVIILLAFQMIYGYLFYKLGVILTFFMAGIAAGGYLSVRILPRLNDENGKRLLVILQGGMCIYPFILSALLSYLSRSGSEFAGWAGSNILFILLSVFSGFLGGAIFPVAGKLCLYNEDDRGKVAGINYGVDLFGSSVGALLTGVFLIPILGVPYTCLAIAALNFNILLVLITGAIIR